MTLKKKNLSGSVLPEFFRKIKGGDEYEYKKFVSEKKIERYRKRQTEDSPDIGPV